MVPINISEEILEHLARTFECSKGFLHFTYLSLPPGIMKPKIEYFLLPDRILASVLAFLSQVGRLGLNNPIFSSLPSFYMCTFKLPKMVIKQIDKKHCLWRGFEVNGRKPPKAACKMVCKTTDQGGLDVINLKYQNFALLLTNLHNLQ